MVRKTVRDEFEGGRLSAASTTMMVPGLGFVQWWPMGSLGSVGGLLREVHVCTIRAMLRWQILTRRLLQEDGDQKFTVDRGRFARARHLGN